MSLYEMIKKMPMFEEFSDKEKKAFVKMEHTLCEFRQGDTIIKDGESLTSIFLLVKGSVLISKTVNDAPIRLAKLRPGEIFGEMSFFSHRSRQSNVIASEDVLAIKIDENFFKNAKPGIKDKINSYFIEVLVNRLDAMNDSIMTISKLVRS
ncbi:MAG: cyclic nucleotide-binding domain-containing protein [Deltaproteobacteria bacterium]|nr:cyclic nucleotide-binding domain-containing protein [Deltaproteobacteria bacterium]